MARPREVFLEGSSGPLTSTAGVTVNAYDTTGASRTAPALTYLGTPGLFALAVSDADENVRTMVLVDAGAGAEARYTALAVFKPDNSNQFWCVVITDTAGALWTGSSPTVGGYRNAAGAAVTPEPGSDSNVGLEHLVAVIPSATDIANGVFIRLDGPTGSAQPYWHDRTVPVVSGGSGGDVTPPVVTLVTSAALSPSQAVVVDVTDNAALGRVLVVARLGNGVEELVHNGDRFTTMYTGSISAISGGRRITALRRGGWPGDSFAIDVYAFDAAGQEA